MIPESVITACLTVITGVIVYSISKIVSDFLIEPIHKLDEIRGEIADSLVFYADRYSNPGSGSQKAMNEASSVLRQKATLLMSRVYLIRWYGFFSQLRIVPNLENVKRASSNLIGLSNSIFHGDPTRNNQWAAEIADLLNLR